MIKRARQLALQAHGGQKYGAHPYSHHLDQVVALAEPHFPWRLFDEGVAAALLHDAVEDTGLTIGEIEHDFGPVVADAVGFCTDADGPSRRLRKRRTYLQMRASIDEAHRRMHSMNPHKGIPLGVVVKMADRLANLKATLSDENRALGRMYLQERGAFLLAISSPLTPDVLVQEYIILMNLVEAMVQ